MRSITTHGFLFVNISNFCSSLISLLLFQSLKLHVLKLSEDINQMKNQLVGFFFMNVYYYVYISSSPFDFQLLSFIPISEK